LLKIIFYKYAKFATLLLENTLKKIKPCDILLSCGDADRSFVYKELHYSPLIDSFTNYCEIRGISVCSISDRISHYYGERAYNSPYTANRSLLMIRFVLKVIKVFGLSEKKLFKLRIKFETIIWRNALLLTKPRIVIGIQPDIPLCIACNEQQIPIYDLQHGVITGTDDNRYYSLGYLSTCNDNYLPYGFLVWDKASEKVIRSIPKFKNREIFLLGNPWYTRFINPDENDILVNSELLLISKLDPSLPIIIVTLQYKIDEYAPDYVPDGVMTESLRETIGNTQNRYQWIIRLHPSQLVGNEKQRIYLYLDNLFSHMKNVQWEWCSAIALPALLKISKLHITHYSATTIEAAWMNVPTILLDPHIKPNSKHETFYLHERSAGYAYTVPLETKTLETFIKKIITGEIKNNLEILCNNNLPQFIEQTFGLKHD